MDDLKQTPGAWIFIIPIGNLVLTDAVNREVRIERVLFIDKKKLPRIRRRLGINTPLSEIKASFAPEFFDSAETFACVPHNGKPAEIKSRCLRLVRDELSILTVSQLGYVPRKEARRLVPLGEDKPTTIRSLLLNRRTSAKIRQHTVTAQPDSLTLDGKWKHFQQEVFFLKLLKILNGRIQVDKAWRQDLRRSAILIGQSINSSDVPTAFLLNMIALEMLLTQRGDKYSAALPNRIEAFLGWTGFWSTQNFEERIKNIYEKRSKLVHNGEREVITRADLLFSDDLVLNLLMNIIGLSRFFTQKNKVIDFAAKLECERKLGIRPKVRPKGLRYVSRQYTQDDYDEI